MRVHCALCFQIKHEVYSNASLCVSILRASSDKSLKSVNCCEYTKLRGHVGKYRRNVHFIFLTKTVPSLDSVVRVGS